MYTPDPNEAEVDEIAKRICELFESFPRGFLNLKAAKIWAKEILKDKNIFVEDVHLAANKWTRYQEWPPNCLVKFIAEVNKSKISRMKTTVKIGGRCPYSLCEGNGLIPLVKERYESMCRCRCNENDHWLRSVDDCINDEYNITESHTGRIKDLYDEG